MKNKKMLIAIVVVALVLVVAAIILVPRFLNAGEPARSAKTITVTVVHGDGTSKDFTYQTEAEYLGQVLVEEKLVEGENDTYGLMIHTVDGEKATWEEDHAYWALYIGEEYALTGVDQTSIHDGDAFRLVYTIDDSQ